MFCSVKKHDGWGVSLHDLFLTSCCVKAPWLCNLPRGLKQCRLEFFFFFAPSPFPLSWFVTVLSWCLFFPESSFDLVFTRLSVVSIRSRGPKLASPAIFCPPEQMAFVRGPFHTLEDREGRGGMRRVAGGPAKSDWEVRRCGGGGRGLSWGSSRLRTGCVEQAAAAAAQAERTLATTSADQ